MHDTVIESNCLQFIAVDLLLQIVRVSSHASTTVPSSLHEDLVDLFRGRPTLAPTLLADALGVALPAHCEARVVESTLNDRMPTEYRADLVVELSDGEGRLVLAIILEIQLDYDQNKPFTWPAYVGTLRARKRCPVCLLIVSPDETLAAWCRRPIELGPGMGMLTPLVLGPRAVPVVTDQALARCTPEIAVLSAMAHGNDPDGLQVLTAMLSVVAELDEARRDFYLDLVASQLNAAACAAMEAMMEAGQAGGEQLGFMAQLKAKMEAKAKAEAKVEAKAEVEAEAKAEAKAEALLTVLQARGLSVSEAARTKILACMDLQMLDRWVARAVTAPNADAVVADP
jgi:hypothetical protein